MKHSPVPGLRREIEASGLPPGLIALWSLGNMGFVLKGSASGPTLVFDPYLTASIEVNQPGTEFVRAFPPPLRPEDLSAADVLLISHEHDDHLDPGTIGPALAAKPGLRVVVPEALAGQVRSAAPGATILEAREGVPLQVDGVRIFPVAAAHPVVEHLEGRSMRLGYLVELNGVRVFHAGDTVVHPGLVDNLAALRPDVVILPINGGDWFRESRGVVANMGYRDAVELAARVRADLLVGAHFDLFHNNRDRPSFFVDYLFEAHPEQKFHLFTAGERLVYARSQR
jgi:L-ascorbate metabolism protein UlaG (beta-lactamase superfamily)